jgi:hypothetical protein
MYPETHGNTHNGSNSSMTSMELLKSLKRVVANDIGVKNE